MKTAGDAPFCGVFGAFFLLALASAACAGTNIELVKDGKSAYVIVVGANASPSEKRGAEELRKHIEQMSGATLPIVTDASSPRDQEIVLGINARCDAAGVKPDMKELGPDGFVLKTVGQRLFITGSSVRGTMYGCSDVLEKLGVRWFTPTVTKLPRAKDISLPALDEKQVPAFEYREPYFTEAWDKDWAARNRVVGHTPRLDESTGGKISYADFVHSLDRLVPPALYEKHPEYFPLIDGKRTSGYVQRCLSNPEVLKLAIAGVREAFKNNPGATITTVSQNDCEEYCRCPQCTELANKYGGQSGVYLWFVNQVAEAIEKELPDKLIDTLAYQFTEAPPKNIRPRANVRIRLCPIACCQAHAYDKCTFPANAAFIERLKGWHELADVLYVWHYSTHFPHYLMPFPDFNQFPASARMYKRNGVKGVFFQGAYCGPGGSDAELRAYVMARLLWNVDVDTDALVTEWMQGVYGPAWRPMRTWFDLCHATFAPLDDHMFCYDGHSHKRFTSEILAKADAMFDEAEKLAATDSQRLYIKKARLCPMYLHLLRQHDTGEALTRFLAAARSLGMTNTSEKQSLDEWENEYRAKK